MSNLSSLQENEDFKDEIIDSFSISKDNTWKPFIPIRNDYHFPRRHSLLTHTEPELSETPPFFSNDDKLFNHHYLYLNTIIQEDEEKERIRSKSVTNIWDPNSLYQNDWSFPQVNKLDDIKERFRRLSFAPISNTNFIESNSLISPLTTSSTSTISNNNDSNNNNGIPSNGVTSNVGNHGITNSLSNNSITSNNSILSNAKSNNNNLSTQKRNSVTGINYNTEPIVNELAVGGDTIETKVDDMGKGTRFDSDSLLNATFYVVEFKGGRSDVYYGPSNLKLDDLVILEADRGRDLGKITQLDISRDKVEEYYGQLKNTISDELVKKKFLWSEIYIKSIFRLARLDEITLLIAKTQDEAKALMICQSKIKQKKLTMQVVDAEYQWDRRKLTFYFIAEKRVDFRELVRELFKLYKTRIWMCAVNSIVHLE